MTKTDPRAARSKAKISSAFLALLEEQPFSKISVSMIIKKAGVNRSTFYAHYLDKFDLLDQIEIDLLLEMKAVIFEDVDALLLGHELHGITTFEQLTHTKKIIDFIYDKKELIALIMKDEVDPAFLSKMGAVLEDIWQSRDIQERLRIPQEYLSSALTGLFSGVMAQWIRSNFTDSKERLNQICLLLLKNMIRDLLIED